MISTSLRLQLPRGSLVSQTNSMFVNISTKLSMASSGEYQMIFPLGLGRYFLRGFFDFGITSLPFPRIPKSRRRRQASRWRGKTKRISCDSPASSAVNWRGPLSCLCQFFELDHFLHVFLGEILAFAASDWLQESVLFPKRVEFRSFTTESFHCFLFT